MTDKGEITYQSRRSHGYISPTIFLVSHSRWKGGLGLSQTGEIVLVIHSLGRGQETTKLWPTPMEASSVMRGLPLCLQWRLEATYLEVLGFGTPPSHFTSMC